MRQRTAVPSLLNGIHLSTVIVSHHHHRPAVSLETMRDREIVGNNGGLLRLPLRGTDFVRTGVSKYHAMTR